MARRGGRPGAYLMTDDYTGFTRYATQLKRDFWGSFAEKPLQRNMQEISSPLNDPEPVTDYRGPNYETYTACALESAPLFVGNTTVRTNPNNPAFQALNLDPAIPDASVGCTLIVH